MNKVLHKALATALMLLFSLAALAQGIIEGLVTDQKGDPVIGASITLLNTSKGTVSDFDGTYRITGVSAGTYTVSVTYIGYDPTDKTVTIRGNETLKLDFALSENNKLLDEVVVVGYGVQRKRDVVGAIAKVDGDRLMETQVTSFEAALQGQAAGVGVIQGSGIAGAGAVIRIRGISSISAGADPLYVIDGIPITADNFLAEANWQNGAFNNNPLSVINPADIQSIEILKDASAAGIYGSRGTNGVILITTKRGRNIKPTFNFSINLATSNPVAKPRFLNSQEWIAIRQEAWENDGNTGPVWLPNYSSAADPVEVRLAAIRKASQVNTDWWDEMTQTGFKQQYNFGANWGNRLMRAYVGVNYSDNESYMVGNKLRTYGARANFDFDITRNFTLGINASYSKGINRRVRVAYTGGLGEAMSTALPIYPVRNADGSYWRGENSSAAPNPVFGSENFQGYTLDDRLINSITLNYRATERLTFAVNGGYDYLLQNNDIFETAALLQQSTSRAERDSREVNNVNVSGTAEYRILASEDNDLRLMLGTELQRSVTSGFNNLVFRDVASTQYLGDGNFSDANADRSNYALRANDVFSFISYFARANYMLKNRYIFQASGRVDGSSKFGPNNRYGFFPVAAAGWVISDEPFFNRNFVSFLKLKTSYGLLGNSNIPSNEWVGTYSKEGLYNRDSILYPQKFENPNLKWETTRSFDLGIELGLLEDRFFVNASYYKKRTVDALLGLVIPNYFGGAGVRYWDNVGEILNEGVDLGVTAHILHNRPFRWTMTLNAGYNYNEIISLGNYTEDAVSGGTNDTRAVVGYPVGANYLIRYYGVDPENGRPIYLDADGNQTYEYNEARDRAPVGNILPRLTGGWQNSFAYKGLEVNFLFVFSWGGKIYDSSSKRQMTMITDWNIREDVGDRWRKPGDIAIYPKATMTFSEHGNDKEWFNTNLFLHDGSYVRLRNISVGYQIPANMCSKLGLRGLRVALTGTNLLTFTKFPGLDPEVARDFDDVADRNMSVNITYLTPPQEKSVGLNINLIF